MTQKELDKFRINLDYYEELKRIARALHKLDEHNCNYGLTKRQEARKNRLHNLAQEIAGKMGLEAYHQGDPRGCSLYLILPGEEQYTRGIPIL